MSAERPHVFLSYAREDQAIAERLAKALERLGHPVWWDSHLAGGENFRREIEERINRAGKVLVLWTPHSVKSGFVIDEAHRGMEQGKLLPVSHRGTQPPLGFGHIHRLELADPIGEIERIVAALTGAPPGPVAARRRHRLGRSGLAMLAVLALLVLGGAGLVVLNRPWLDAVANGIRFGTELRYATYRSRSTGLAFIYPKARLSVDTTKEADRRFRLFNSAGETEVEIFRARLPASHSPIEGLAAEQAALQADGATVTFTAPQLNPETKNWYALSGYLADGRIYYFRRWYTKGDLVSMEFRFAPELRGIYDKILTDMSVHGITIEELD